MMDREEEQDVPYLREVC